MTLKVIGSGFGRTGTKSLKDAIEFLGIGRCYHMAEVFGLPKAPRQWIDAAEGRPDWPAIFEGFSATVDWPSTTFYRELAEAYPDARVIHTERDADEWFDSTQATIFAQHPGAVRPGDFGEMAEKVIYRLFDGRQNDRAHAIDVYRRHNETVRRVIPASRLLVYELAQGWEPLCGFLGVPVPDVPMIKTNTRDQFIGRARPAG